MTLQDLVVTYQPRPETIALVRSTRLVFLVGIAGAGKNTLANILLKDSNFMGIISHTTRPPRVNNGVAEVDGVSYHFIDSQQAEAMIRAHEFVEVKYVHGTIYGTSEAAVRAIHDAGKIGVTDIDVQGVAEYAAWNSQITPIFILPPDYATWEQRLATRYSGRVPAEELAKRRQSAISELRHALAADYYHFVVNDDMERAAKVISGIAHGDVSHEANERVRQIASELVRALAG